MARRNLSSTCRTVSRAMSGVRCISPEAAGLWNWQYAQRRLHRGVTNRFSRTGL